MKNPQKKSTSTKKPPETKIENQDDQYMRMTTIALDIIEAVQSELNSGDSQSLLKNFMEIKKTLQSEVSVQFEKNKYQSQIEETFNKNFDIITNYFIKCLQIFDNVKVNSIENLKTCLTQLFQIVSNELSKKDTNITPEQEQIMQTSQVLITQEEKFVYLINSLSTSIKTYMKNTKSIIKEMISQSEGLNDNISQCKMSLNDLMIQASLPSIGKSSLKVLKDRTSALIEKAEVYSQLNADMQKGMKQIDSLGMKFYDEAKDIFRKLKLHHNQKMNEIKRVNNEYGYNAANMNDNYNTNSSNVNNYLIRQKQSGGQNRRNQSVSPTRKRIFSSNYTNNNTRNTNYHHMSESNQTNSNANTLMKEASKSSEHYKSKTIAGRKGDNANKQLNMSHSTNTHYDTSPNFYSTTNHQNQMINDLNDKNQSLKGQIAKLSSENKKLKIGLIALKKNANESIPTKSMPKSKSLRNFLSSNPNPNANVINDINNIQNNVYVQSHDGKFNIDSISKQLAEHILSFLESMKELQNLICKKASNISELKKEFEKQKKELYHFALIIQSNPLSNTNDVKDVIINTTNTESKIKESNEAKGLNDGSNSKKHLKDELSQMKKFCKDNEAMVKSLNEEIKMKNNEIAKISLELQKAYERKKQVSNQAKLKEFENKIQAFKSENDQFKTVNLNLEAKIAELTNQMHHQRQQQQQQQQQQKEKEKEKDKRSSESQSLTAKEIQMSKENEELKGIIEDIKSKINKLKKRNAELNETINSNQLKMKQINSEKEEHELKYSTMLNELSSKTQEMNSLTQSRLDLEKERKEIASKLMAIQSELKESKKSNDKLKADNDKYSLSIIQLENENTEYKSVIASLKQEGVNYQDDINKYKEELNKVKEKEQNALIDLKAKLSKKDSELNELKKVLLKIETKDRDRDKDRYKATENNKLKEDIISQTNKDTPLYKKEYIEVSQMLHQATKDINEKYKELRIALSFHEIRKNPNDPMLINEEDEDLYDLESEKNATTNSIKRIDHLMNRNKSDYNEINQTILLVFKLFEKHIKQTEKESNSNTKSPKDRRKSKEKGNKNDNIIKDKDVNDTDSVNADDNDNKTTEELREEISNLKSFFTECTNTIFEAIKVAAPHMVDEESDLSLNLISGANTPVNLLDSNNSPVNSNKNVNTNINTNSQPFLTFDPEFISSAVAKFKMYNNEINEQIKKLEQEKEDLEREAHNNLVKAQAYKTALDDAIMKINSNSDDMQNQINKFNNNNSTNSGNVPKDNARTFTVEDLENPQSEHNKPKSELSMLTKSKMDYRRINNDLMLIQADLLKKMEMKEEECQKLQESVNNLLKTKDSKDSDLQISGGKYKQLLLLYTSEQKTNHELKSSYYSLLNEFSDFVNQKDNKKSMNIPLNANKNEITLGNEEEDDNDDNANNSSNNDDDEEEEEEEDDNKNKFKGKHELSDEEEEYKPKGKKVMKKELNDKLGRNHTHDHIKYSNQKENYLGLLNEKDVISNHSVSNNQDANIQELLNENKNLEEQEKLLMTQLQAVKKELKETREQVKQLSDENSKLKARSGSISVVNKEDVLEPLKNALEKLIYELTFTPKIKEIMTVILRVVGYSDEKIIQIYNAKEKKKGFFNLFK